MTPRQPVLFVNYTHPDDAQDRQVRSRVNRHVMLDIGRARRVRPRRTAIPLEVREQPPPCLSSTAASGFDLDNDGWELVRFTVVEAEYKYRPLRVIWNKIAFQHPLAVNLSIATAAIWRRQVSGSLGPRGLQVDIADYPESSRYYTRSLARTVEILSNETDRTSADVIVTVLGLACYDVTIRNWERWAYHANGLAVIAQLRGGIDDLGIYAVAFAAWIDVAGGAVIDRRPGLPLPFFFQPALEDAVAPRLRRILPQLDTDLRLALLELSSAASAVNSHLDDARFWTDDIGLVKLFVPAAHALQSASRDPPLQLVRLAGLILLSTLKRRLSLSTADMGPLLSSLMFQLAARQLSPFWELNIWALITAALQSESDERALIVAEIKIVMAKVGLETPEAAIEVWRQILWMDILPPGSLQTLADQLSDRSSSLQEEQSFLEMDNSVLLSTAATADQALAVEI